MCFDVENECIRKKFQECHVKDFFIRNTKGIFFLEFFLNVDFFKYFKCQPTWCIL
jgi:hypothetical protein